MPTLFVYLPCYNEAGNLRRLTEEWLAEAEALARTGYQLTVIPVDDRSTDDTLAIARQLAQEQARVRVIASRYQPGARVQGLQASRKLFSDGARLYYTLVLHVPGVKDYTCGYRVYTRPALQAGVARYGQALVEKKSFACMMELLYKLYRCGCTFAEVPFTLYYDSKEGESKMNLGKTIRDSFLTALRLRVRG